MRRRVAFVLMALALAGCQDLPGRTPTVAPPSPLGVAELRADALTRLERGDLDGALRAAREAATRAPDDVPTLYLLGVAHSRLDQREEAVAAFRRVLERGPRTAEAEVARRWLAEAGALSAVVEAAPAAADDTARPAGRVEGHTEWPRLPEQALPKLQILLVGHEGEVRGRRYAARVDLNQPYAIADVRAGQYQLMAQVGSTRLWEQPVTIEEGKTATIDLTPATAVAPADALHPLR